MRDIAAAVETVHNACVPMPAARSEDENYTHYQSWFAQRIESTREQALRGFHANLGVGTIRAVVNAVAHPNAADDSKVLVEAVHLTEFNPYIYSFILKVGKSSLSVVECTASPLLQPSRQDRYAPGAPRPGPHLQRFAQVRGVCSAPSWKLLHVRVRD